MGDKNPTIARAWVEPWRNAKLDYSTDRAHLFTLYFASLVVFDSIKL